MDTRFTVVTVAERLKKWRRVGMAACEPEHALAAIGQGANDPHFRELSLLAKELREGADHMLAAGLRCVDLAATNVEPFSKTDAASL